MGELGQMLVLNSMKSLLCIIQYSYVSLLTSLMTILIFDFQADATFSKHSSSVLKQAELCIRYEDLFLYTL